MGGQLLEAERQAMLFAFGDQTHHLHRIEPVIHQIIVGPERTLAFVYITLQKPFQPSTAEAGIDAGFDAEIQLGRRPGQQLRRADDAAATPGHIGQRHAVLLLGKIGHGIAHQEGLDIAHEGIQRRRHATDVRVHADDQQLIAAPVLHHLLQGRALEGAVTPLHQHGVARVRRQRGRHRLQGRFGRGQAGAPHIVQQGPVLRALPARLRGVHHRHAGRLGPAPDRRDMFHQIGQQGIAGAVKAQEVFLHIVYQQDRALRVNLPLDAVGWKTIGLRHGIRGDDGYRHGKIAIKGIK